LENNFLLGTLPFQSSTPNSTFQFAPQKIKPPTPQPSSFNPIILPALLSTLGFVIIVGAIIFALRRKSAVQDGLVRRVSGSTLASKNSFRTSKSSSNDGVDRCDIIEGVGMENLQVQNVEASDIQNLEISDMKNLEASDANAHGLNQDPVVVVVDKRSSDELL
jgi:hypothetical protein